MNTDHKSYVSHPDDEDTYDLDRYGSADDWEPPDPYKKLREKARREDTHIGPWNSMVEVRSADEVLRSAGPRTPSSASCATPADLFGPLWREGELAVLAAETGVGKSILATQIAASIAKGQRIEPFRSPGPKIRNPHSAIRNRKVLYIDLERSPAQFRERYSAPSANGKRRVKHHFGPNMQYLSIRNFEAPPPAFKKDLDKYLLASIAAAIAESPARVIIIDSLSYLAPTPTAATRLIKTLKLWTQLNNLSILAIKSSPPYEGGVDAVLRGRRGGSLKALTLRSLPASIAEISDSVFAIGRSTMAADIRYIKHLKSTNLPTTLDATSVATFRLTRESSPPYEGGVDLLTGRERRGGSLAAATEPTESTETPSDNFPDSPNSQLSTLNSPLTENPFLGFQFLGLCPEEQHLKDYAAEYETIRNPHSAIRTQESSRLKRLRTGSVVDMVLSPEYQRYLKGE